MTMNRRDMLKMAAAATVCGLTAPMLKAEAQVEKATRGMAAPKIKDISVIEC
jgi:mannonate dehydratase